VKALAALLLAESVAAAAGPSALWDDVARPDRLRCEKLIDEATKKPPGAAGNDPKAVASVTALADEAVRRCPRLREAQALLGHVRLEVQRDYAGALAPLERALALEDADPRLNPLPGLAFELGLARAVAGDLAGSLDAYRRAEAAGAMSTGQLALLLYDMGDSYQALGRLREAIDAYRRAVKLAPREAMHHWALGVALDRDGQLGAARAEVEAALGLDARLVVELSSRYFFVPPADHWYYLALAYRAQGRVELARQAVASFLHDLPDGPYAARARELQASLSAAP